MLAAPNLTFFLLKMVSRGTLTRSRQASVCYDMRKHTVYAQRWKPGGIPTPGSGLSSRQGGRLGITVFSSYHFFNKRAGFKAFLTEKDELIKSQWATQRFNFFKVTYYYVFWELHYFSLLWTMFKELTYTLWTFLGRTDFCLLWPSWWTV